MALGGTTLATVAAALKDTYTPEQLKFDVYKMNPTLAQIAKVDDFEGNTIDLSVQHGHGQGVGPTIALATTNQSADLYKRFTVPRKKVYGVGKIDGETIRATRSNKGSLVRALAKAQDGVMKALRRYIAHSLFSNGGGSIGKIAAGGIAGAVITLANPGDTVWFEPDMILQLSVADGTSGAVKAGTVTILSVQREAGTVTCTGNVTAGIATAAAADFIFRNGCFGMPFDGIFTWVPKTAALAATTLYTVDRSVDPTRLGGLRYAGGASYEECLQLAMAFAYQESAEIKKVAMAPLNYQSLVVSLGSKVQYVDIGAVDADIGFKGVQITSPVGTVDVYPDIGCPSGFAVGLDPETWEYHTLEGFPDFLDEDGLSLLRESGADEYSWRMGAMGNLICTDPSQNMVITLPG